MADLNRVKRLLGEMAAWYVQKRDEERRGVVGARWAYGVITATSPLTVTIDGDTDATPATSTGYVPPVGTKVHVVIASGQAIILAAPSS